jgi:hypothetical protein
MSCMRVVAVGLSGLLVGAVGACPATPPSLQQEVISETSQQLASSKPERTPAPRTALSIKYRNNRYGFCFSLPEDWDGYSIVVGHWRGYRNIEPRGDAIVADGPTIIIRHPEWRNSDPRQDIPIMVFTTAQWFSVNHPEDPGGFLISAAPMGPEELGRNRAYVFALPPRYNYAFPKGYEQVNEIMRSQPLHAPCR